MPLTRKIFRRFLGVTLCLGVTLSGQMLAAGTVRAQSATPPLTSKPAPVKPAPLPLKIAADKVKIIDFGIYQTSRVRRQAAPNHVSGWRNIIAGLRLIRATDRILAQAKLSFGIRYELKDPSLAGRPLTRRLIFPPMTNPKNGKTATSLSSRTIGRPGTMFSLFTFDYGWEMTDGIWRFQLLDGDRVLLDKSFRVIVAIN